MLLNIPVSLSVAELLTPLPYFQDGKNGPTIFGFTVGAVEKAFAVLLPTNR